MSIVEDLKKVNVTFLSLSNDSQNLKGCSVDLDIGPGFWQLHLVFQSVQTGTKGNEIIYWKLIGLTTSKTKLARFCRRLEKDNRRTDVQRILTVSKIGYGVSNL